MEEILEGLKLATARGESLQQAMQSFYNAGYKKEDIENAARVLQEQQSIAAEMPAYESQQEKLKYPAGKTVQKVSEYAPKPSSKKKIFVIILIVLMLFVLGALAGILLFKEELLGFINKLM